MDLRYLLTILQLLFIQISKQKNSLQNPKTPTNYTPTKDLNQELKPNKKTQENCRIFWVFSLKSAKYDVGCHVHQMRWWFAQADCPCYKRLKFCISWMSVRKAGLKCVCVWHKGAELCSAHSYYSVTWSCAQVNEQDSAALQQFLAVSTKDAYYLPKFGIFPMVVGYSFFRVVAAFAWCSSRLKGFLVGVFWMCVLFLLPQLGLFLSAFVEWLPNINQHALSFWK